VAEINIDFEIISWRNLSKHFKLF